MEPPSMVEDKATLEPFPQLMQERWIDITQLEKKRPSTVNEYHHWEPPFRWRPDVEINRVDLSVGGGLVVVIQCFLDSQRPLPGQKEVAG